MLTYSYATLCHAFNLCLECSNYKVGIAYKNQVIIRDIFHHISASYLDAITKITKSNNGVYIRFYNGSELQLFPAKECSRGRAFHLVIVDGSIDDKLVNSVFRPLEKMKYINNDSDNTRKE